MEILFIGIVIILVWLGRALHNIKIRDQAEADKKMAFAMWAKEQRDPHLVSIIQNFMNEGRFKTLEEAALYAEQALNTSSPEPRSSSHANDT